MRIYITEAPQSVDTSKYSGINFKDRVVGSSTPSKDKINPSLLADVDKAAEIAGTKASVTTAVTGHKKGSRHESGLAVDLAMFDGKGYGSKEDAKKKGIYDKIEKFVKALEGMGYKVNSESGNDKAVLWFGFPNHHHHVHVSRKSDDGTSSSSSTVSKTSDTSKDSSDVETTTTTSSSSTSSSGGLNLNTIGLISALGKMSEEKRNRKMNKILTEISKINNINKSLLIEGSLQVSYPKLTFGSGEQYFQNTNKNLLTDLNQIATEKNLTISLSAVTGVNDAVYVTNDQTLKSKLTEKGYGGGKTQNPNKYYQDYSGSVYVFNNTTQQTQTDNSSTTTTTTSSGKTTTSATTVKVDTSSTQAAADSMVDSVLGNFLTPFASGGGTKTESIDLKREKLLNEINRIKKNML